MRIRKKSGVALVLLGLLLLNTGVYAADALYRFMHNDHDALIIGEITSADENAITVRVEKNIISSKDLNAAAAKKQLKPDVARVEAPLEYSLAGNPDGRVIKPSVGDYVLLSLNKHGSIFKVAWGAYKVDSLDYRSLSVVLPEGSDIWSEMDAAAIKAFVNSNGKITEFSFDGDTKTVRAGEEQTVIFDGADMEEDIIPDVTQDPSQGINKKSGASSVGIIGGADGPTSIYVSGSPAAPIISIAISAAVIFAIAFAMVYAARSMIKKNRKLKDKQ